MKLFCADRQTDRQTDSRSNGPTDGQQEERTDMMQPPVALLRFVNAPKIVCFHETLKQKSARNNKEIHYII